MFKSKSVRRVAAALLLTAAAAVKTATAAPIHPDEITVEVGDGANSAGRSYKDDVFLKTLVFDGTNYAYGTQIVSISEFEVLSGRKNINAEWGDWDDASDGDDNPFAKAGFDPSLQETTDPFIQDETLENAFNSASLSEMSDGEGGSGFWFRALFEQSLTDNQFGPDTRPELAIFERGRNDVFDMRLITGGTFEMPELSDWLQINSRDFARTGVYVDTIEISAAQEIGLGGFDLDAFNLDAGARVYGLEIRTQNGSGPDLNGMFLTADEADRFGNSLTAVPVTASSLVLMLSGFAFLAMWFRSGQNP